jgi:hypothetical protein
LPFSPLSPPFLFSPSFHGGGRRTLASPGTGWKQRGFWEMVRWGFNENEAFPAGEKNICKWDVCAKRTLGWRTCGKQQGVNSSWLRSVASKERKTIWRMVTKAFSSLALRS